MATFNSPIWKDVILDLGTAQQVNYTVMADPNASGVGTTVYTGSANKRPSQTNNTIIVNEICRDYLSQSWPDLSLGLEFYRSNQARSFSVRYGTSYHIINFYLDYSYDYQALNIANGYPVTMPIDGVVDYRMLFLYSSRAETLTVNVTDAITGAVVSTFSRTPAYSGNYWFRTAAFNKNRNITIQSASGTTRYTMIETCAKYALYYVNKYGGWDWLVMQGEDTKIENYDRKTMITGSDNIRSDTQGKLNHINQVEERYILRTGMLTDEQASLMPHLLGSTLVYLCDINDIHVITGTLMINRFYPAIINNSNYEQQRAASQGRPAQYSIDVSIAADRTRR